MKKYLAVGLCSFAMLFAVAAHAFLNQSLLPVLTVVVPTASLSASPSSISSGSSSTLTWAGSPTCISPGSLGYTAIPSFSGGTFGTASTGALSSTTTYSVQCGTATASATVTVTGGTVACDLGNSYAGNIPAAATQAGFTHCAVNYDFTQTGSFTDNAGTHQWSNLSSWFSCNGSAGFPYLMTFSGNVGCLDGIHQTITTDSGVQVLALKYLLTDAQAGHGQQYIRIYGTIINMPEEYYIEMVIRFSSLNCCSGGGGYYDFSTFTDVPGNPCFVSTDQEFDQGATGTGVGIAPWNHICGTSDCCGTYGATPVNGPINTSVTTWGALMTADNVSKFAACNYQRAGAINGLQSGDWLSCLPYTAVPPSTPGSPPPIFHTQPMYANFVEGPQSDSSATMYWTATSHTTYVQRLTIWECSGYATGQCFNNPVITTGPP